jgi:hypothetical protein
MDRGKLLKAAFPELESTDPVGAFGQLGDLFHALSYAWLYWPKAIEIHGAVFIALDGGDEAEIRRRLGVPYGDEHPNWPPMSWSDAVESYNRVEIEQLFRVWHGPAELVGEAALVLGEFLRETWRHRLADLFPDRSFSVELKADLESDGPWIQVRQTRPELVQPQGWDAKRRFIRSE